MFPVEILLAIICISSLCLWLFNKKEIAITVAISFSFLTFFLNYISYPSLLLIILFSLSCFFYKNTKKTIVRFFLSLLILFFAALPFSHVILSSNHVPIFDGIRFSSISPPLISCTDKFILPS